MRRREQNGPVSVHAIAGSYVTLLGLDKDEARTKGALGFAIERTDHTRDNRRDWLAGFKAFPGLNVPKVKLVSTREHPIQSFQWCDSPRAKTTNTPIASSPCAEHSGHWKGEDVSARIKMENEDEGTNAV